MVSAETSAGPGGPSSRAWCITLALACLLYLAPMLALLWDFLPHLGACVLDTRHLACSNYDKIYELERTYPGDFSRAWNIARQYFSGGGVGLEPMAFNLLPTALVALAGLLLPLIAAYNLVVIAAWQANGLAACALAYHLTRHRGGALLCGFLFAFAPLTLGTLYCRSLDYGLSFVLPLLLLLAWLVRQRSGRIWPVLLGLGLVLLGLVNQYYLVGFSLLLLAWAAYTLWSPAVQDAVSPRTAVLRLALACAGALLLLSPWLLVEVLKLQAEHPTASRLLIDDNPDPPALFWSYDLQTNGLVWLLLATPLAVAGVALRGRLRRADGWFLAAVAVAASATLYFALPALRGTMQALPVLWRMREVDKVVVIPLLLVTLLAGAGWAALSRRVKQPALLVGLHLLLLAACTGSLLQGAGWWRDLAARSPSLTIPDNVIRQIQSLPRPQLVALATDQVNEHLPYSFQLTLRHRTGLLMMEPEATEQLQQRLQQGLGISLRGDVKSEEPGAPPRRRKPAPRCMVLALFGSAAPGARGSELFSAEGSTQVAAEAMARLGFGKLLHRQMGLLVAASSGCVR